MDSISTSYKIYYAKQDTVHGGLKSLFHEPFTQPLCEAAFTRGPAMVGAVGR